MFPAIYPLRGFAEAAGLVAYSTNFGDLFREAAGYIDRVLKGARPGDLPVQQAATFELLVNLGAAKALGLTIPADDPRPRRRGIRMNERGANTAANAHGLMCGCSLRLEALLAPYPSETMTCRPVSVSVGNIKNNHPSLIEPIAVGVN